jgi:hypothetical protein
LKITRWRSHRPAFSKSGFLGALSVRRFLNPAFSALSTSGVLKIRLSRQSQRPALSKSGFRGARSILRYQTLAFLTFGFLGANLRTPFVLKNNKNFSVMEMNFLLGCLVAVHCASASVNQWSYNPS